MGSSGQSDLSLVRVFVRFLVAVAFENGVRVVCRFFGQLVSDFSKLFFRKKGKKFENTKQTYTCGRDTICAAPGRSWSQMARVRLTSGRGASQTLTALSVSWHRLTPCASGQNTENNRCITVRYTKQWQSHGLKVAKLPHPQRLLVECGYWSKNQDRP